MSARQHALRTAPKASATPSRLLLVLLVLSILCVLQLLYWIVGMAGSMPMQSEPSQDEEPAPPADQLSQVTAIAPGSVLGTNWRGVLAFLRRSKRRYVIIDAKNGLGNRLRALASAMSVAEYLHRPVLLVWVRDLHLNCSVSHMFAQPLPFALLEAEIPRENFSSAAFQVFNYMRPEPGAVKDEAVDVDPDRHLVFRSAFVMNHPLGGWPSGGPQQQIRRLQPSAEVAQLLVADRSMVGLHVRNVFDAPRDAASNVSTEGAAAMDGAQKEYGAEGTVKLLQWRRASHWTNFVHKMISLLREQRELIGRNASEPPLRFYLAADSEDAYTGMTKRFPGRLVFTRRECAAKRCDFRDCRSQVYALVDMLNLARTKLILGSGYSSYSEVAAQMGGSKGSALPILMAGRDFGTIVERRRSRLTRTTGADPENIDLAGFGRDSSEEPNAIARYVQHHWPRPF